MQIKIILFAIALIVGALPFLSKAQEAQDEAIVIAPLFDYPVAPEDLTDLNARTNWLMQHFWEGMDFKKEQSVDQNALNDAFGVYTAAMQYADKKVTLASVDNLIKQLKKNPTLLLQFTKAAEENLYGPRAGVWIDEVYMKFLKATAECKKLPEARRIRYADQMRRLQNSMQGTRLANVKITDASGKESIWTPSSPLNIIEFGSPDCDACRYAKNLFEVDYAFRKALEDGKVSMTFVIISDDADGELMRMTSNYPSTWAIGYNPDIVDEIDIRDTPSFYIVDAAGKVIAKNITVNEAISLAIKSE